MISPHSIQGGDSSRTIWTPGPDIGPRNRDLTGQPDWHKSAVDTPRERTSQPLHPGSREHRDSARNPQAGPP